MNGRPVFRAGSLLIAVGALSLLVLHACSSAKRPAADAASQSQVATAQAAAEPNATATATTTTTTVEPATPGGAAPEYMPATKAGGAMFFPEKQNPPPMQQAANPPHANAAP